MGTAPYPPRFKGPTLHTFDGIGSPNQHIYHFKSQTRNVVSNDTTMTRLFIGTLKRVAFEWFIKLHVGFIKTCADLKKLFLTRFFKDDKEVAMPTPLATSKRKESLSMLLWRDSRVWHFVVITPCFPKYGEVESRRRSATYIREENTLPIHANPKVT